MSEQQQYQRPAYPAPQTSGMAVASLVCSILGFTLLPTLGSVIGIILGYVARNRIRGSGGIIGGDGLATWGIILGWVGIALTLILLCVFIVLPIALGGGITICALFENGF